MRRLSHALVADSEQRVVDLVPEGRAKEVGQRRRVVGVVWALPTMLTPLPHCQVTDANKAEYVTLMVEWKCGKAVAGAIEAFRTGFFEVWVTVTVETSCILMPFVVLWRTAVE